MVAPDFVGRDDELLVLRRQLDRALAGEPVVSLVEGEAGMGKTRLAQELAAEAAARDVRVVWVEADEAERPALGLCDRIVRTVGSDAGTDPTLPPSDRRWEVVDSLVDLLREAAPILVVLDDLHWADEASCWAIERVPRRLAGAPVCLLGTARPDEPGAESLAGLRRQGDVVVVRGLAPDAVAQLVADLPAGGPVDAVGLAARTGGNPLFVRELVTLGDGGELPHAIRDVLARNLRRLEPAAQETLTVLALAGPSASVEVCAAALGIEPVAVAEHLDRAAAAGIVRWSGGGPSFCHPLYGEVAAALAAPARRRELHAALADAWEGRGGRGERSDRAARVAAVTHRLAALPLGDAASAGRDALGLAGDLAGAGDAGRAAEVSRAALHTLRAAGGVPRDLLARLALAHGEALWATGAGPAASAALEEAAGLVRDSDDAELAAACEAAAARFVNPFVLDAPRIRRLLACEAALPAGDDPVRVDVLSRLAVLYSARPDLVATGHVHGDAAVDMARRLGDSERLVTALTDRHFVPLGVDGSTDRRAISEEIVALGDRLGRPDLAFAGREWQFEDAFERADRAGAERALAVLDVTAVVMPSPEWRYKALSRRSMLRLCDGDRAAALDLAAELGELGREVRAEEEAAGLELAVRTGVRRVWGTPDPRHDELVGLVHHRFESPPPFIRIATASAAGAQGDADEVRRVVEDCAPLAADLLASYRGIPLGALLGDLVADVGGGRHATALREALGPYAGRLAIAIGAPLAVDGVLGRLASLDGDHEAAEGHGIAPTTRSRARRWTGPSTAEHRSVPTERLLGELLTQEDTMPYATITEADHTLDLFDQVDALVPREPEGLLLLIRGRTERGVAVVSVWRSREESDRFFADHLAPALAQVVGDPIPAPLLSLGVTDVAVRGQVGVA